MWGEMAQKFDCVLIVEEGAVCEKGEEGWCWWRQ